MDIAVRARALSLMQGISELEAELDSLIADLDDDLYLELVQAAILRYEELEGPA